MAGDSKGAHNLSKARAGKRRKTNWQDDRSTNKIYASNQPSVVNNVGAAAGRVSGAPKPVTKRTRVVDRTSVRTADEYYRGDAQAPTAQQIAKGQKLGPLPPVGAVRRKHALPTGDLTVHSVDDIQPVLAELADRLQAGATGVSLFVANVDGLLRRTRAAFEMLQTKEIITEAQYHEVTLKYVPHAAPVSALPPLPAGVPEPASTVEVDDSLNQVDPLAFLNGDVADPDDAPVDVEAAPVTEHTDAILRDGEASPQPDDDGDDFLLPETPAALLPIDTLGSEIAESGQPEPAVPETPETGGNPETPAPAPKSRGRRKATN